MPEEVREISTIRGKTWLWQVYLRSLYVYCNPTDNFDVCVDGWVFMLADFDEALCSVLLTILTTYSGNAIWWKKADLHHDGGNG
jgi:hypothetical protein